MDILISKKKEKINKNNDYVKEVICRGYYLKVTFVQNVGDTPSMTFFQIIVSIRSILYNLSFIITLFLQPQI